MDKKTRKRIEVLKEKLQNRRQRMAGAIHQSDDADEAQRLKSEIAALDAELRELRGE